MREIRLAARRLEAVAVHRGYLVLEEGLLRGLDAARSTSNAHDQLQL